MLNFNHGSPYFWNKVCYSLMNMRQLHILFNSAKTWHVIVCWFLCFPPNLPELCKKLFCSDVQNNFLRSSGKFRENHRNQQTITCHLLAELNRIWSCLILIKLYMNFGSQTCKRGYICVKYFWRENSDICTYLFPLT